MSAMHSRRYGRPRINLAGSSFGRWTVIKYAGFYRWFCRCRCGEERIVRGGDLRSGDSTSCGCFQKEFAREQETIHGLEKTSEYRTWINMRIRCHSNDSHYGGRGITVCERWQNSFQNFIRDIGRRPSDYHTLERIDNNGNYEPGNCRWATKKEQANNRRSNRYLTHNGVTLTMSQWSDKTGITKTAIASRIHRGWDIARVLSVPTRVTKRSKP